IALPVRVREGGDSCGNSTCPKTPQSGLLEEAKAVPAESIRPDRSRTAAITHVLANQHALTSQFKDNVSKTTVFSMGEHLRAVTVPIFEKRVFLNHIIKNRKKVKGGSGNDEEVPYCMM